MNLETGQKLKTVLKQPKTLSITEGSASMLEIAFFGCSITHSEVAMPFYAPEENCNISQQVKNLGACAGFQKPGLFGIHIRSDVSLVHHPND
jgi:hypothetical protein